MEKWFKECDFFTAKTVLVREFMKICGFAQVFFIAFNEQILLRSSPFKITFILFEMYLNG